MNNVRLWTCMSPEEIESSLGLDMTNQERPTVPAPKWEENHEADRNLATVLDLLAGPSPGPIKW